MCGIIAVLSLDDAPVQTEKLHDTLHILSHRGPDEEGVWTHPTRKVAIAHSRLSIIDLTQGIQPLSSHDKSIVACVNGEFYGYNELRSDLTQDGYLFKTQSDSEILIPLYERYGVHAIEHLRGEFSFVIWDAKNRTLVAGRDRFGIKPLHYTIYQGQLLVASEAKALFALGLPARWDMESMTDVLFGIPMQPDRSLFEGVRQLEPGHVLIATDRQIKTRQYWNASFDINPRWVAYPSEAIDAFRECFLEAIRLRLVADVPIGIYLSGGLDSSAILGAATRLAGRPLKAFTLSFEEETYDEHAIACEMAQKAGADYIPLRVNDELIAAEYENALWNAEKLFFNSHGVAKYLLSRKVRECGLKVVLTGEGADEILAGYPHFRQDLLRQEPDANFAEAAEQLVANNPVSRSVLMSERESDIPIVRRLLGFVPSFFSISFNAESMLIRRSLFRQSWLQTRPEPMLDRRLINALDLQPIQNAHFLNKSLYLWSKLALPDYVLTVLGDRMEMAHSVEGRVPFLDHKLAELANSLPISLKIKGPVEKYILRESMKEVLTDTIYKRQKHPFLAPPGTRNESNATFEFFRGVIHSELFKTQPFFDPRATQRMMADLCSAPPEKREKMESILNMMVSTTLLAKHFEVSSG